MPPPGTAQLPRPPATKTAPELKLRTPVFTPGPASGQPEQTSGRLSVPTPSKPEPTPARPAVITAAAPAGPGTGYRLRPMDPLIIQLSGIPEPMKMEVKIDEAGFINLPLIGAVQAKEITTSDLEKRIQKRYIEDKYYRQITINVLLTSQGFFVQGEVRAPSKYPLVSGVTLMQAIAAAGGYTEFANPKKIEIIRGDVVLKFNAEDIAKSPERDIPIEAGDVIQVRRSIW